MKPLGASICLHLDDRDQPVGEPATNEACDFVKSLLIGE